MTDIVDTVKRYVAENSAPHDREHSWDHCYEFFQTKFLREASPDYEHASLHLGFYLASWGMYRGSSRLLKKDYRVHCGAVRLLPRYAELSGLGLDQMQRDTAIEMIFRLCAELEECYGNALKREGEADSHSISDTLVTKIMLGTLACVPAYDTYFKRGLEEIEDGKLSASFGRKSFSELGAFCSKHSAEFDEARRLVRKKAFEYPMMKVVDMYFWQVGSENGK